MKITKRQLRRIIREEKQKIINNKLREGHGKGSVVELKSIIEAIEEIADGVSTMDPDLAQDLSLQVERLLSLHRGLEKSAAQNGRTPTEEESGIPDSKRSVIHNRRPDW